jgi:PIN domain nuclease of toxin-antitoxin system
MYYVADTHAFVWYLTDDSRLSRKARNAFESAEKGESVIIVPAIVLLECIDIADKKKVKVSFEEIVFALSQASNFIISEVTWSLILETNRIKGFKDLHDRVVVAEAKLHHTTLISKDKIIKKLYKNTLW